MEKEISFWQGKGKYLIQVFTKEGNLFCEETDAWTDSRKLNFHISMLATKCMKENDYYAKVVCMKNRLKR